MEDEHQTTNLLVQNSSSPGKPTQKKKYSGNNRPIQAFELHTSPYKKEVSYSMSNQFNSNIVTGNSAPQPSLSNTLPSKTKQEIFSQKQTSAQAYQQVNSNVGSLLGPNKQRRLHSAKANRQPSSSKTRPYSAKPITQQVPLLAHSSQFLAQNSPSIQQQPVVGTSPIKSQLINRKNIAKLVPASPKQSKEELYTIALQSKIENNALKDENIRLQTRLNFIEQRLSLQDQSGNIAMLLKQLNACKQRCNSLSHDLSSQQQLLKSTVISEIKTENEMYKNELIRLRALLESGLGGGLRVMMKKREQMSQEVKSKEPDSNFIKIKKANQDQQKQISQLQHQLTEFECYHQQDLNILKQELTCKFASDEQQLRLQHHQELTVLKSQFQSEIDNLAQQNYQQITEHNQRYDNLQKQHEKIKIMTQNETNQLSELQNQLYEQDEYINLTLQNHQSEIGHKEQQIIELQQQLADREEKHFQLMFKNVEIKELNEKLQIQNSQIFQDMSELQKKLENIDEKYQQGNSNEKVAEIVDLQTKLAEKEQKHFELLFKHVDLKNLCEDLTKQVNELKQGATQSVNSNDLKQEIFDLRSQLEMKEEQHYQLLFKNVDLKNLCEQLSLQIQQFQKDIEVPSKQQEIEELTQQLLEKEEKHYQLLFKNVDLKNLCEELQKQILELKSRGTSNTDDCDLKFEIIDLKQQLADKEEKHYHLLFKNADLKNLCDQLSQKVEAQQSITNQSTNEQDLKQEIADLKNECAEIADKHYQLVYEKVDLKNLCDSLSEELGALKQNAKSSAYDQELKQEVEYLTQQLADKEEKHYQLLFKNVDLKNLCDQLTLKVQELSSITDIKPLEQDTKKQISYLTQQLAENEEKYYQLLFKNADLKNLCDQQQTKLEMLRNLCDELSIKVDELQKKLVSKEVNLQDQQQQEQAFQSGTNSTANEQDLKQEIADLKNECSEIAEKNYQLVYEKLDLKNLCEDLSREINELKQATTSQTDSYLQQQVEDLTQQLAEKEEKYYQLLFKNVDLKNFCEQQQQSLQIQNNQINQDNSQIEEKYYKLLFQNADLKALNDDLSRKLTEVEVEFIQSKAIISNLEHLRDEFKRKNYPSNTEKAQTLGVNNSLPILGPQLDGTFERASESTLKQAFVLTSTDEFNQYDVNKQQSTHEQSDAITAEHSEIKECLYLLKRACQTNYIRFDQIENFIFGNDYRPELRITMAELANKFKSILKFDQSQSGVFSRYLVEQGITKKEGTQISQDSKVLQCRVVTTLIQNLNMNCQGVQVYSQQKERKMKLIIGQVLSVTDGLQIESFEQLAQKLQAAGISSETLDCALVYLLRMSDSLSEVTQSALNKFINNCKKEANSHSMMGMSFPLQDELLEYSITDDEQDKILDPEDQHSEEDLEFNDRQESSPVQSPNQFQKSKLSLSQSFDSGREEETPIFRQDKEGDLPHNNAQREDSNQFDSGRDDEFEADENFDQEFDGQETQQHEIGTSPMPVGNKLNQESNSDFSVHDDDEEFKDIERQNFRISQEPSQKQKQSQSNQAYSNYSSSEVLAEPMSFNQPIQDQSCNSDDLKAMQTKPEFVGKQLKYKPNEDDEAYIIKSQNRLVGVNEKVQKLHDSSVNDFLQGEDIQEDIIEGDFVSENYSDEDRAEVSK